MLGAFGAGLIAEILEQRAQRDAVAEEMRQRLGRGAGVVPTVDRSRTGGLRRNPLSPVHRRRPYLGFGRAATRRA
jgi:hypothetical protein